MYSICCNGGRYTNTVYYVTITCTGAVDKRAKHNYCWLWMKYEQWFKHVACSGSLLLSSEICILIVLLLFPLVFQMLLCHWSDWRSMAALAAEANVRLKRAPWGSFHLASISVSCYGCEANKARIEQRSSSSSSPETCYCLKLSEDAKTSSHCSVSCNGCLGCARGCSVAHGFFNDASKLTFSVAILHPFCTHSGHTS